MKKYRLLLSVLLINFLIISCSNPNGNKAETDAETTDSTQTTNDVSETNNANQTSSIKIAFIRTDSLLINYKFHTKIQDAFIKKTNRYDKELKEKGAKFQQDAYDFQVKQANGSFISQESYMAQGNELKKREQELYELNDRYTTELAMEKEALDKQIEDSVNNIIKVFNKDAKYDFIFRREFMLHGNEMYDITDTITALLNMRYEQSLEKNKDKK